MREQPKMDQLYTMAEAIKDYETRRECIGMVMGGFENAAETDGIEIDTPEYEDMAVRTLASNLSDGGVSVAARKFFDRAGVVY